AFPTGVIAALSLQGEAKDITVQGSTTNSLGQTAYVATGDYGLAVVDASQFDKPILLGQIDLPGDNVALSVGPVAFVAAVVGSAGLHLVDVTNPMMPVLRQTILLPGQAAAVSVLGGLAYVATGAGLVSVDVATGDVVQTLPLGGDALTGLAREGTHLF